MGTLSPDVAELDRGDPAPLPAGRPAAVDAGRLAALTAALVGARAEECLPALDPALALDPLLAPFFRPAGHRLGIALCGIAGPSVAAALGRALSAHGLRPERRLCQVRPRPDELVLRAGDAADFLRRYGHEYALVWVPAVDPVTGTVAEVAEIAAAARAAGCRVGCDATGAVGTLPLRLHDWDLDLAVWRHGEGQLGAFVHERNLQEPGLPEAVEAGESVAAALLAASEVGVEALRARSGRLTEYLERRLRALACELVSPETVEARGPQVSLRLETPTAGAVASALGEQRGVAVAAPAPDVLTLAPSPLVATYDDCDRAVAALAQH